MDGLVFNRHLKYSGIIAPVVDFEELESSSTDLVPREDHLDEHEKTDTFDPPLVREM
jgi:hypothetical protein